MSDYYYGEPDPWEGMRGKKMAKEKNPTVDSDGWEDPLVPPTVADGYVKVGEQVVAGVVMERGSNENGAYYIIKLDAPCKGKAFQGDEMVTASFEAGQLVQVNEVSGLRPLADRIKKGPTRVRIEPNGKKGNRFLLAVRCKPAF